MVLVGIIFPFLRYFLIMLKLNMPQFIIAEKQVFLNNTIVCPGRKQLNILEIGAGEGANLFHIAKMPLKNTSLLGLDSSRERTLICKRFIPKAEVILGDGLMLPLSDSSIDFVICTMVIEHVADDSLLINEVKRVLKRGGSLYISTVIRAPGAVYLYRNFRGQFVLDPSHVREYISKDEILHLFKKQNLVIKRVGIRRLRRYLLDIVLVILARCHIISHDVLRVIYLRKSLLMLRKLLLFPISYFQIEILVNKP